MQGGTRYVGQTMQVLLSMGFFPFLVGYVEERPWWPIQSPNKRKKEESEWLSGMRDQIKLIDLRFEWWKVVGFRKARKGKRFHKLHVLGMIDDL